jgi:hypothetical protein
MKQIDKDLRNIKPRFSDPEQP